MRSGLKEELTSQKEVASFRKDKVMSSFFSIVLMKI